MIPANSPANRTKVIPLKRRIAYFGIIYLAFVLILALVEIAARIFLPPIASLDLFVNTTQQRAQVADAKQSSIFEGDPLLLWRLKPNLREAVWDFTVLSTNAQGLRVDYPVGVKAPGVFRIVCLGDSVTFGYRVPPVWPDKPTEYDRSWLPYPMLLEKQLRAANPGKSIEVITMAVPGYTSHQGLAWLKRDLETLEPDLLTVSFGWNDVSFSEAADHETVRTGWLPVTTRWFIDHSQAFAHVTRWLRSRKQNNQARPAPRARVSQQDYLANMLETTKLARAGGAKVVVIAAPYRDSFTNPGEARLMNSYRTALRTQVQALEVPFLEIRELTEAAYPSNEGWFGELIHPNHMGHRLMASELLKLIAREKLANGLVVPSLTP